MSKRQTSAADDEALSALLDGELADDAARRLRSRLQNDPVLAARLAELETANDAVRSAYAAAGDGPLPERVVDLLRPPGGAARRADVAPLRRPPVRFFAQPAALAASVALAFGLTLGILIGSRGGANDPARLLVDAGRVEPGTALYDALQSLPSATPRELGAGLTATARFTFETMGGGYCRQIDLESPRGTTATLACLGTGGWQIEVASFAGPTPPDGGGVYRPAAGNSTAIDGAIDELIRGEPLGPAAEADLIAAGWRTAAR